MNKIITYQKLFFKRIFSRKLLITILIIYPIICAILNNSIRTGSSDTNIGIVNDDIGTYGSKVTANLASTYKSINFKEYNSINDLKNAVASKKCDCGYYFGKDFTDNVKLLNLQDSVTSYVSPGTINSAICSEYVYSEIFSIYAYEELRTYISKQTIFSDTAIDNIDSFLKPLYEKYLSGKDTFSFEYINSDNVSISTKNVSSSYLLLSINGLTSLFILIYGFIGGLILLSDKNIHLFYSCSSLQRISCELSNIFISCMLSGISGFCAISLCKSINISVLIVLKFFIYLIICTIYCYILHLFAKSHRIYLSIMIIVILGSIICCPIFVDLSELISDLKYIGRLFPSSYFI